MKKLTLIATAIALFAGVAQAQDVAKRESGDAAYIAKRESGDAAYIADRKSGVEGKSVDRGVTGVQACALPIFALFAGVAQAQDVAKRESGDAAYIAKRESGDAAYI